MGGSGAPEWPLVAWLPWWFDLWGNGVARPSEFEQRRRRREFWRVLAATGSVVKATAGSGLSEAQVLRLLEPRESLSAALELVEARAS